LKPDGDLLLVKGLADAITMRQYMAEYWYFRICGHLHMLSRRYLDWLSKKVNVSIADVQKCCHY
jgi:hypothetical protein